MTDKILRSFASGLLVAASVSAVIYFFDPKEATIKAEEKPSTEEMKSLLQAEGFVIHTEAEWNELTAVAEAAKAEKTKEKETNEEIKNEQTDKVVYRTILTVSEGMTSIDVGRALVSANIIDNAMDFTREVEKRGVAKYLKLGTYEINSDMTVDEVISTVFK